MKQIHIGDEFTVPSEYIGTFDFFANDGLAHSTTIEASSTSYKYCFQDMLRYRRPVAFPVSPRFGDDWMTEGQKRITGMYGLATVGLIVVAGSLWFKRTVWRFWTDFFARKYVPNGEATNVKFSELNDRGYEAYGYVPQVTVPGFQFPLLACDVSGLNEGLIGWNDPYEAFPYDKHNLIFDVSALVKRKDRASISGDAFEESPAFSVIKHYPPSDD
mmetsp:Transcript_9358/g.14529  ORF Transcript_9358/g.14529 Transcript_9358/m.14529 type:complete len:216 (-) Transcript_9358:1844-2491(-)